MAEYIIHVPGESDPYQLTKDLGLMVDDIKKYLGALDSRISGGATSGGAVNFSSITATVDMTTPIISIGGASYNQFKAPFPSIVNDNAKGGFGLVGGSNTGATQPAAKFTTSNNTKWTSNVPIEVPYLNYTVPNTFKTDIVVSQTAGNAVNPNVLQNLVKQLDTRYALYSEAVDAFNSVYSAIGKKADHSTSGVTWVENANNATYASYALGLRTEDGKNRNFNAGMYPVITSPDLYLAGGASTSTPHRIAHGLKSGSAPIAIVTTAYDTGVASIVCNVTNVDATYIYVNMKNTNSSTGEHFRISWFAISN